MADCVYREDWDHALELGETEQYRQSLRLNRQCAQMIEEEISKNYKDNCLDSKTAATNVIRCYGLERVAYVLANTAIHKDWDARISRQNKEWAARVRVCTEREVNCRFVVDKVHPGLTDLLINTVRDRCWQAGIFR